jgi:hypothetical protein
MLEFDLTFIEFATTFAIAALVIATVFMWRRLAQVDSRFASEIKLRESCQRDMVALLSCSRNIADRIHHYDSRQDSILKQLDTIQPVEDVSMPLEHANELIRNGLSVDAVTTIYDLNQGESALLQRLNGQSNAA